jgi:predicted nucleotidyltransferase
MKTKDQILEVLRGLMPELEKRYNVKTVGLFGSALRGDQSSKSDIDVLVEFSNPIGFFKFLEMEEFLSERLGGKVDLVSKKALKPEIGRIILAEAVMA